MSDLQAVGWVIWGGGRVGGWVGLGCSRDGRGNIIWDVAKNVAKIYLRFARLKRFNSYICIMDVCKQCKKELVHVDGRRKKVFCNDTCRSNFWYEQNVKNKPKVVVKNLTQQPNMVEAAKPPTTNYTIDTTKEEQIRELEEKIKLVPNGQYYNQVIRGLRNQINKLKYNQ